MVTRLGRGAERQHAQEHQQGEGGGDRRQVEEVESDVPPKQGIGLANRNPVQRHEHRHPLRRRGQRNHECNEQRARQQDAGNKVRNIQWLRTDAIHVECEDPSRCATAPADIAVQECECHEPCDNEEQRARDERRDEDRFEVNLLVPEPVGRKAGEPRDHDHREEHNGEGTEGDAAQARAEPRVRSAAETCRWESHSATKMAHQRGGSLAAPRDHAREHNLQPRFSFSELRLAAAVASRSASRSSFDPYRAHPSALD
jgi:hypothetical protein